MCRGSIPAQHRELEAFTHLIFINEARDAISKKDGVKGIRRNENQEEHVQEPGVYGMDAVDPRDLPAQRSQGECQSSDQHE